MTEKTVDWLVQEINDLLDVSSVGLYEFMNFLNDPADPVPLDQRRRIARHALERVVAQEGVGLYWLQWPDFDRRGAVSIEDLPADAFSVPDEGGLYIAVDRA
jgi:hypothetical protein